jgi:hypothetical protein
MSPINFCVAIQKFVSSLSVKEPSKLPRGESYQTILFRSMDHKVNVLFSSLNALLDLESSIKGEKVDDPQTLFTKM